MSAPRWHRFTSQHREHGFSSLENSPPKTSSAPASRPMNAWVSTNTPTKAKASLYVNQDKASVVCGMQLRKNVPAILVGHGPADRLPAAATEADTTPTKWWSALDSTMRAAKNVAFGRRCPPLPASDEIPMLSKFPTILIGSTGASCKSFSATDNGWHGLPIPFG